MAAVLILAGSDLTAQKPAGNTGTVWAGVYTATQAERGDTLYRQHCATCHGNDLSGGEIAPGVAGEGFISIWDGTTLHDFFEYTRSTMPLDDPGQLAPSVYEDIIAFLLRANQFPPGDTALRSTDGALRKIKISRRPSS